MRGLIPCVAFFVACSPGFAQAPAPTPMPVSALTISGETTVAENHFVQLTLSGGTAKCAWLTIPTASQFVAGQTLLFTGPPGTYQIICAANQGDQPLFLQAQVTITPSATPSGPLAIAIFDPSTLTTLPAGQASIYQSTTIGPSLAAMGVTWLQYSSTDVIPTKNGSSPITQTKWGQAAIQCGFSALVTSVGGTINAIPLPANEAAVIQACQRLEAQK
jgi:hypothetical protein